MISMERLFKSVLLTSILALATGCGSKHSVSTKSNGAVPGALLLQPFKAELQQALKAGLSQGPFAAIDACRIEAPRIADEQSVDGILMGRSSHRLRNPLNAAPAWVRPIMDTYRDDPSSRSPLTVSIDDERQGYVEAIIVQPMCTVCHGNTIDPDLKAEILKSYPEDNATGFSAGDLRGIFWVEYPAGS